MKKTVLLLLTLLLLKNKNALAQAGGALFGYVYEQNSGHKPVDGVLLKAFLANQVTSTNQGTYQLSFQNARPGTAVLLSAQKESWVVTNKNGLEANLPEDPLHHPHNIVMCKESVWKQQNQSNRAILEKYLQQSYEKKIAGLSKQNKNYQKMLDSLQDQYTQQSKEMGELTDAMSRINLDDVTEKEKEAYQLFQQGDIEGCKKLRESLNSEDNFLKIKKQQQRIDSSKQVVSEARQNNIAITELHRRNLREEARIAELQFNFQKAEVKLRFLADNDTTDFESLFAYGAFIIKQGQYKNAVLYFKKAQAIAANRFDNNRALLFAADAYGLQFENDAAKAAFHQALLVAKVLAAENPGAYSPHLGNVLMLSGIFYSGIFMNDSAEVAQKQALEIMKPLTADNPGFYQSSLLAIQNSLALILYRKRDYKAAEKAFQELLATIKNSTVISAAQKRSYIAGTSQNLGLLYFRSNNYAAARQPFLEALETRRQIQKENLARYNQQVVGTLISLGDLYEATSKNDTAEYYYQEAIKENNTVNDIGFYKKFSDTDLQIKILKLHINNIDDKKEELKLWKEIIEKRKALAATYKDKYTDALADELGNYGWELLLSKQYAAAEQAAREGLELVLPKEIQAMKSTEWLNGCLAPALLLQGKYEEAEKIYTALKDKPDVTKRDGTTYKTSFLSDLDEIEKAGIQHNDISKIRELLNRP